MGDTFSVFLELLQQGLKHLRRLLQLIQLLLRHFSRLQQLFNLFLRISLKVLSELIKLLHHLLELSQSAWHLTASKRLKKRIRHLRLPPL